MLAACEGGGEPPEVGTETARGGAGGATTTGAGGEAGTGGEAGSAVVWEPVETDWCSDGWVGLEEHTCFHVPATASRSTPVVHVLHGAMPPDALPAGFQAIAAEAADALGFVAVFPRGKQGLCGWDPSVEDHFCWPTRRETVDAEAPALLEAWMRAEAQLLQVLGATFSRRYIMGFSNGGYFSSYVTLEGLLPVDGGGLVGAGRSVIEEELFSEGRPPIYLAVGALETAGVIASAENLTDVLTQHGWEHAFVVHPERGHEIRADDFASAWETWAAP